MAQTDERIRKTFDNPISKIMRKHFPTFKINRRAKDVIEEAMFEIHAILIQSFERECEFAGNSILRCVQAAITVTLPTNICRHALAEASRKVLLFQNGLIYYDPVSSFKRFIPDSAFKEGIKNLTMSSTGATSVPQFSGSGKNIASIMSSTADFISTKVANYSRRQNLTEIGSEHVMEVVKEMFPKILFEHAKVRGHRNVSDFQKGLRSDVDTKRKRSDVDTKRKRSDVDTKRKKSGGKSPSGKKNKSGSKGVSKRSQSQDPSPVFKTGNRKILTGLTNGEAVILSTEANGKVSQILYNTASFLSSEASDHLRNQSQGEMDFLHVKQVMNEHFSRNLFEHALLCGLKNVNSFVTGELQYRRRQPSIPAAKSVTGRKC